MNRLLERGMLFAAVLFVPAWAMAQGSSIAGVVRDTSGGVLPGVTVEAASPALIEKVRSAVSDSNGQYRIIDLRPGTYSVTFVLPGFSTVRRDGLVLVSDFTATVNADLQVGALAETITVTGESPVIDVTNMQTQQRVDRELITSVPSAQGPHGVMMLVPSVHATGGPSGGGNAPANVQLTATMVSFGSRGGRPNDGQLLVDGLSVGAAVGGGGNSAYGQLEITEEVVYTAATPLGEAEGSGPVVNMIPRSGSNLFQQRAFATGLSGWMQANNYSPEFARAGVLQPQQNKYMVDSSINSGGPIIRDRRCTSPTCSTRTPQPAYRAFTSTRTTRIRQSGWSTWT